MIDKQDEMSKQSLREQIRRMSSSIPRHNYSGWDAAYASSYKELCIKAQRAIKSPRITAHELQSVCSELNLFWK